MFTSIYVMYACVCRCVILPTTALTLNTRTNGGNPQSEKNWAVARISEGIHLRIVEISPA